MATVSGKRLIATSSAGLPLHGIRVRLGDGEWHEIDLQGYSVSLDNPGQVTAIAAAGHAETPVVMGALLVELEPDALLTLDCSNSFVSWTIGDNLAENASEHEGLLACVLSQDAETGLHIAVDTVGFYDRWGPGTELQGTALLDNGWKVAIAWMPRPSQRIVERVPHVAPPLETAALQAYVDSPTQESWTWRVRGTRYDPRSSTAFPARKIPPVHRTWGSIHLYEDYALQCLQVDSGPEVRFEALPVGRTYVLSARSANGGAVGRTVHQHTGGTVEVPLKSSRSFRVEISHAENGAPLSDESVLLRVEHDDPTGCSALWDSETEATTSPEGLLQLEALQHVPLNVMSPWPPPRAQVEITAPGFEPWIGALVWDSSSGSNGIPSLDARLVRREPEITMERPPAGHPDFSGASLIVIQADPPIFHPVEVRWIDTETFGVFFDRDDRGYSSALVALEVADVAVLWDYSAIAYGLQKHDGEWLAEAPEEHTVWIHSPSEALAEREMRVHWQWNSLRVPWGRLTVSEMEQESGAGGCLWAPPEGTLVLELYDGQEKVLLGTKTVGISPGTSIIDY